eukprot:3221731-Pleurochrysis_carterae.AAC.1
MQALDSRCASSRTPRIAAPTLRLLAILVLLANATALGSAIPCILGPTTRTAPASLTCPPAYVTAPPKSAFALAADLLETSTCVSLMRGHLMSAFWSLAKANMFWLLHAGHA